MTVEAAAHLPLVPYPDEIEWTLVENVGHFSPLFGFQSGQRTRYGVARWRARIRYSKLSYDQRSIILGFVAAVGTHRAFWVTDWSNDRQGVLAAPELITSPELAATWTADAGRAVTSDSGGVRVSKTSGSSSGIGLASAVTVESGKTYALRGTRAHGDGQGTVSTALRCGSTQFASNYGLSTAATDGGRHVVNCQPAAASAYVGAADTLTDAGNWTTTPWYVLRGMSLVRALEVDGGTSPTLQYGGSIYVRDGDASQAGALKAGDMAELVSLNQNYAQMVRMTEDLNTDSSGKGLARFEPPARGAVAVSDLLIPTRPMCRMILVEPPAALTIPPRYTSDLELTAEEEFSL